MNEAAMVIHMGSKLDKAENFFTNLAPDNFTKFVHLQVSTQPVNTKITDSSSKSQE